MILLLLSSFFIALSLIGYGHILQKWVHNPDPSSPYSHWSLDGLWGFFCYGLFSYIINFFIPLSSLIVGAFTLIGILLFSYQVFTFPKISGSNKLFFVITILLFLFVVGGSVEQPSNYDTGLYHLQSIKWFHESATPWGLANLHGRLGFNSLWLGVSSLMWLPIIGETSAVFAINALLVFFFFTFFLSVLFHSFSQKNDQKFFSRFILLFLFVLLTAGLKWFSKLATGSPNTDTPGLIFFLLSFYFSFTLVNHSSVDRHFLSVFMNLLFFCFLSITVKVSQIPVLLFLFVVPKKCWELLTTSSLRKFIVTAVTILSLASICWFLRSLMLSGCFVYPVVQSCFADFPWSVSPSAAIQEHAWIFSWARDPGLPYDQVLSNWSWVFSWTPRFFGASGILPLSLYIFVALALLGKSSFRPLLHQKSVPLFAILFIGITYWFLTAPDVRFGIGYFLAMTILLLHLALQNSSRGENYWPKKIPYSLIPFIFAFILIGENGGKFWRTLIKSPLVITERIKQYPPNIMHNYQNKAIYLPTQKDQCWDLPLPCTPYFDKNLTMNKNSLRWSFSKQR